MLELDDIQHILLTRTPALTGEYLFVSFRDPTSGRKWLNGLLDTVRSAADAQVSLDSSRRWVTLAFTWNGLRALGLDEASLCSFPEEFKQGMVARAEMLGDTEPIIPTIGSEGLRARTCTRSPFSSPATPRNVRAV